MSKGWFELIESFILIQRDHPSGEDFPFQPPNPPPSGNLKMDAYCCGGFHKPMGQPQVSVVIPVWNGERYLKQAIESILAQDFVDFELIVIDDGSTDRSAEIVSAFAHDPRVALHKQANAGVVAARNAGLRLAQAEFVAFLDADDIALPGRLVKQVAYLRAHPETAVIGSNISYFSDDDGVIRTQKFPFGTARVAIALETGNPLAQPSVMLRKTLAIDAGGYREAFRFGAEDYDLWLRLAEKHPLDNLPEVLTLYRIHAGSLTHRLRHEQTLGALAASCARRRRIAGLIDPVDGILAPLTSADLPKFNLSKEEEATFMPSLLGMLSKQDSSANDYAALARRAWELRRFMSRGRLVRHCLAPAISALRKSGRYGEAFGLLARALVTEPLSAVWILLRS
jgi:glycosyltransferase involved in cell wall biosynthesis